jgi:diguanylate cyclase (GGDEF)-like protein
VNYLAKLEKQNKPLLIFLGFIAIGVIGVIDFLTGYEFSLSVFYVLPISFVTWLTSRRFGLLASLTSAVVWLSADMATGHFYSNTFIPIWNTLIRFAFFIVITLLLCALKRALHRESELARTDYLTGAVNLRYFYELAQLEIDRLQRYGHPFTLAYIDLDGFKTINDQFGHTTGDLVLQRIVGTIKKHMRKTDVCARLGGDEFALILPETDQECASPAISKIQGELLEEMRQNQWPVTFSIGALTCQVAPLTTDELVKMADGLMYKVKRDGKNGVNYATYAG